MDFRTVVTISALFLMTADADAATLPLNSSATAPSAQMNNTCPCLSATPTTAASSPSSSAPVVSLLTVHWTGKCEGSVRLYNSSTDFTPVCHSNSHTVLELLKNVCLNIKGCKGQPGLIKGSRNDGYDISEDGGEWMISCETLGVRCKVEAVKPVVPDVRGQLQAYKVVTALLCCVLLVLLLIRFTRPTVKALQKRLSDRRQNRWIGPTQSHSVSYHRGKTAVKNDGEKRLSYPALERLAVSDSREPSSNRNSDYNF
ncbi:uncharacterized protein LOC108873383 [Lates calcarifer]|uniref:Uncharacterized protein LOC108873383 n=1 Tax=Lates calcarifer TaxID=8187 RepID=A0AAJ7PC92_LATCA|nr:uncharacterized protein LOC108873383 [Lates calcarifer]